MSNAVAQYALLIQYGPQRCDWFWSTTYGKNEVSQRAAVCTVVRVRSGGYSMMEAHSLPEGKLDHVSFQLCQIHQEIHVAVEEHWQRQRCQFEMSAGDEEEGVSLCLIIQSLVLVWRAAELKPGRERLVHVKDKKDGSARANAFLERPCSNSL